MQPSTATAALSAEPFAGGRLSSQTTTDQALAELNANKDVWLRLSLADKSTILTTLFTDFQKQGCLWIGACLTAKQVGPGGFAEAEEWATFGAVLRLLRLLRQSLGAIDRYGHPRLPGKPATLPNGQVAVPIFPTTRYDGILLQKTTGVTWLEPGVTLDNLFVLPPGCRQDEHPGGRVALVLGAGNLGVIQCLDLLHKLFVEDQVVALKLNPVNAYLEHILEQGFKTLIDRGFLRIFHGGAEEGAYLCDHPLVDTIHLTGSDRTFDAIVFGTGDVGRRNKAAHTPRLAKPVTAELGCITPVFIVPGAWSPKQIQLAAGMLATWLYSNAGFSCVTPHLIIQHRQWPQREALLDALAQALAAAPLRPAYYPGAQDRQAAFVAAHPDAQTLGAPTTQPVTQPGVAASLLPWTLIAGVDAHNPTDICFTTEAFCALLSETALDAPTVPDFLAQATVFANSTVWGTLGAVILAPAPITADTQVAAALDRTVADLHYGTVCVNLFPNLPYTFGASPWGSYPGQDIADIQSGIGFINNPFMLRSPQKSIYHAPFERSDPVTLHNPAAAAFGREYAAFLADPSLTHLLRATRIALRRSR